MVRVGAEDSVEPEVEASGPVVLEIPKPNSMHKALSAAAPDQLADSESQSNVSLFTYFLCCTTE